MLRRRLPEGSRESSLWMDGWSPWWSSWLSLYTAWCRCPGGRGSSPPTMWRGSSHNPLQSFAVASGAVSKPGGDAAGQDALHSAGCRRIWGCWGSFQTSSAVSGRRGADVPLQHCVCVSRPCEILGDVNAEELKAVYPLHRCLVDGDGVCSLLCLLKSTTKLLGLVDVEWEVVLLAPFSQGTHLLSVGRLIVVGDQAYHRCVIGKFDDDVGAVCSCTVVCVQAVQEWAEDAALRGNQCWGSGEMRCCCPILTTWLLPVRKSQDPAAQRSVQSQSLELSTSVAGTMVLNAEL